MGCMIKKTRAEASVALREFDDMIRRYIYIYLPYNRNLIKFPAIPE